MRVLLVEDHAPLARVLRQGLEEENFAVDRADGLDQADAKARGIAYDVILLAHVPPRTEGLCLLQRWRREGVRTCVLVLAAGGPPERVRCLEAGADDCLSSPFEPAELAARLRALIRRCYQVKSPVIRTHDLEVDTASRTVRRRGQPISLTPREYTLLEFLAFHRGKVATRAMICEHLYDEWEECTSNVVSVYVAYLRDKIDRGFDLPLILTRWGEGYMLRHDG